MRRFTLVELMMVVAIVSLLGAIAVSVWLADGKRAVPWVTNDFWTGIGFAPDGNLRCIYMAWFGGVYNEMIAWGVDCDVDGDQDYAEWRALENRVEADWVRADCASN